MAGPRPGHDGEEIHRNAEPPVDRRDRWPITRVQALPGLEEAEPERRCDRLLKPWRRHGRNRRLVKRRGRNGRGKVELVGGRDDRDWLAEGVQRRGGDRRSV